MRTRELRVGIRVLDAVLALLGGVSMLFWASRSGAEGLPWTLAGSASVGLVARIARTRGRPRVACAATAVALVGLFARGVSSCLGAGPLSTPGAANQLGGFVLAIWALRGGGSMLPFLLGAAWLFPSAQPVVAFAIARHALGPSDEPMRQRITSYGAGLVAGTCLAALAFDLSVRRLALGPLAFLVVVDPIRAAGPRMIAELGCVVAASALGRGRGWGWLGVAWLVPSLLALVAASGRTSISTGCMGVAHPLGEAGHLQTMIALSIVAGIALAPWTLPILRSLRGPVALPPDIGGSRP